MIETAKFLIYSSTFVYSISSLRSGEYFSETLRLMYASIFTEDYSKDSITNIT